MKQSLVKVPFGPEVVFYEGEFYAVTRHRIMLFFYFGLACMILLTSMDRRGTMAQPELILGIAAIEVLAGVGVVLLCRRFTAWRAARRHTVPRVHLGWVLVATVTCSGAVAEVLNPFVLGVPRSTPLHFLLKLGFYLTVTELLTSVMMQYTLGYILDDLRRNKRFDRDGGLLPTLPDQRP